MKDKGIKETAYTGTVLDSSNSPVLDFNQADYEQALEQEDVILLYFYAKWCPICREEIPKMYDAFEEFNTDGVIGFRVNYNDGDTDEHEENLAREFGVAYQHTKVILKNGERVLKSLESWGKQRYLDELEKAVNQ